MSKWNKLVKRQYFSIKHFCGKINHKNATSACDARLDRFQLRKWNDWRGLVGKERVFGAIFGVPASISCIKTHHITACWEDFGHRSVREIKLLHVELELDVL